MQSEKENTDGRQRRTITMKKTRDMEKYFKDGEGPVKD